LAKKEKDLKEWATSVANFQKTKNKTP